LHWNVENVATVHLGDEPTTGNNSKHVCPALTTTYTLRSVDAGGKVEERSLTISVHATEQADIEFLADSYEIVFGTCTNLYWRVDGAITVHLTKGDGPKLGVVGEGVEEICPAETTRYTLSVQHVGGETTRQIIIEVVSDDNLPISFWAEQYTLPADGCTTLHWSVEGVDMVFFQPFDGPQEGVSGQGTREQVCPAASDSAYTLRVVVGGVEFSKTIALHKGEIAWRNANEAVARGVVRSVDYTNDMDATRPGNQPGWHIQVDGIDRLFHAGGPCCELAVTLHLSQALSTAPDETYLDWPVNPGQLVEFRGMCSSNTCSIDTIPGAYLKLRSP
jgi:hypothetical protein